MPASGLTQITLPSSVTDIYLNARFWKDFANIITIPTEPTALDNQTDEEVLIYSNGSTIYFKGLTTEYKVFNISGKLIYKGTETSLSLPRGSYIIHINNQVAKVVL